MLDTLLRPARIKKWSLALRGHVWDATLAENETPFRAELLSPDRLEAHALSLAGDHRISKKRHPDRLLSRLRENERVIDHAYEEITSMVHGGVHVPPAGEWLLDNYYVINEHISLAREHLPKHFSTELPILAAGSGHGFPRIYHLATELIAHVDGRVDAGNLSSFITGYQRAATLTIGELWAVPIMLRLALIENLRRVAQRVCIARKDCLLSENWANKLVFMAEKDPKNLVLVLADMVNAQLPTSSAFVADLCRRLQGQSPALALALSWFEQRLAEQGVSSEQLILAESQGQASDQVSIGNSITSLRLLSAIDWREFVERHSAMERVLRDDPAGIHARMDFATRDAYRHIVECIAKKSGLDETLVAQRVVAIARDAFVVSRSGGPGSAIPPKGGTTNEERKAHIGYYLLDKGLQQLETTFRVRIHSLRPSVGMHPNARLFGYLSLIALLTAAMSVPLAWALIHVGISAGIVAALTALFAAFASQTALFIANGIVTRVLAPARLPQMDFSNGIPRECRAVVAVPTMLCSRAGIENLIDGLETRYLSNRDDNVFFALLTDFADADKETQPSDADLLDFARQSVTNLNLKYASDRPQIFYLFHRPRRWNPREGKWMGVERKRGKLAEFNRALRGGSLDGFAAVVGDRALLPTFKYVITLDTDTILPSNAARRLVGAMAHVLNKPVFDAARGRVVDGYGLLQPRVALNLTSSRRSWFTRLFASDAGIDPYTRAVSDLYQDLFGEGSFVGKGIYDVDAFEQACGTRFPENRILSHDLIEGCHARSGLLTDVELFEDYPPRFNADAHRRHRWMRGDWQIARWLLPWVPTRGGKYDRNVLSLLSRWKIFDNLRRSVVPCCGVALLALSWLLAPASAWIVSAAMVVLALLPALYAFPRELFAKKRDVPLALHLRKVFHDYFKSLMQAELTLLFMAYEALLSADAIARTCWRVAFSRRQLLEWQTASEAERNSATTLSGFVREMRLTLALTGALGIALAVVAPVALLQAIPWLAFWLLSPLVAWFISVPHPSGPRPLDEDDRVFLREVARRTWQFFLKYVTPEENWLPPDNFQVIPKPEIASRTSPTNMGVALLSTLSAFDFGFISVSTLVQRMHATLQTMASLPRYQGHLFNWYNTRTLQPLNPHYISSVDSGNLLGHLLALRCALTELPDARLLPDAAHGFDGIADTLRCIERATQNAAAHPSKSGTSIRLDSKRLESQPRPNAADPRIEESVHKLLAQADAPAATLPQRVKALAQIAAGAAELRALAAGAAHPEIVEWAEALETHAEDLRDCILQIAPWLAREDVPKWLSGSEQFKLFEDVRSLNAAIELEPKTAKLFDDFAAILDQEHHEQLNAWREDVRSGAENARKLLGAIDAVDKLCAELCEMKFGFLFDPVRLLLAIGYNASDHRLDGSYYDLLASEARVASYVCIALGQLPAKHWFMLGRKLTTVDGSAALLSWSGSMFEYLMPSLILPCYDGSLLDSTNKAVVKWQIDYARGNRMPWGVSESGFNSRDMQHNYQYRAFGVPGLGFKRGLSEDLVVAPYACVLAAMIAPQEACANLRRLVNMGALDTCGFFEAIDYTPTRLMAGQKFAIVRSFMAHHQGMSFVALGELLLNNPMQRRFLKDPRMKAANFLLQERVPSVATPIYPHSAEEEHLEKKAEPTGVRLREFTSADSPLPEVQLLSNGRYHVMLTQSGAGYSRWHDLAVSRWREDGTLDAYGQFCYLRDADTGKVWCATYQPCGGEPDEYFVQFSHSTADYRCHQHGITSHLSVCVSPEDDVEIRELKLVNTTRQRRRIEVLTYAEVVLNPQAADIAHRSFSNLFVQTELVPEKSAILCTRRPREAHDKPAWMFHQVTVKKDKSSEISFETDRAKFLGRGRSYKNPLALQAGKALSNTAGSVLDPIVSVRRVLTLEPSQSIELELVTGVTESRDAAISLLDKFKDHRLCERAFEVAWTHSRVILSQLNATEQDAQTFCEFAAPILFASQAHRAAPGVLARNQRAQSGLWGYGISGDLPIVLLRIGDVSGLDLVRDALKAHAFLRMKGLTFDLVIWNEDASSYRQVLQDELMGLVLTGSEASTLDHPGGIFIRRGDLIAEEDRVLLQSLARVTLQEGRGRFAEQIDRRIYAELRSPPFTPTRLMLPLPPKRSALDVKALKFFNGLGGFSKDGREYVILLKPGQETPAPWCNVIANPDFGTVVSESGSAYSFAENAHEYRLTPWHNDALIDPSGECFYLRDEESGAFWSPQPKPARGSGDYVTRHGFGYSVYETTHNGIRSELTVFVAADAPIKIALLKIRNEGPDARRLSATGYWEWVLGDTRYKNAPHVITEADNHNGAILSRNAYNADFQQRISFCAVNDRARTVTCDRAEFIGRNGSYDNPAALRRRRLSGRIGGGLDPCTALQTRFNLAPGQEGVTVFVLGTGKNNTEAAALVQRFLSVDAAQRALDQARNVWLRIMDKLQIDTPDPAVNMLGNGWLIYQILCSRVWARSGYYQSGGAYGFRDQLQDMMALTYAAPELMREHLLRCASRQFEEGDVQHWWHPPSGRGVRTQFSDDYLWLPYAVSRYVLTTGDTGVLSESANFIGGRALRPDEEAYYDLPHQTDKSMTVYEHCKRALDRGMTRIGRHGLPLMGCGDWNDGMNLVGIHGEGESVWLAFFLYDVLQQFATVARRMGDTGLAEKCEEGARKQRDSIRKHAWDGKWYLRAFFDDGSPLGSSSNPECQIDSLPQSWAVLSKAGEPERCRQAMDSLNTRLVRRDRRLIQLFDPPFDKSNLNPGYIKAYVPGVRENGGQYTHGAVWAVMAFAEMGDTDRAWECYNLLNPINHGLSPAEIQLYKAEPYVIAADVYAVAPHIGRGGWTWYTGSAGWMYRLTVESLLGIKREVNTLHLRPRVPKSWKKFSIRYRFRETLYKISMERGDTPSLSLDGAEQKDVNSLSLVDDGREHEVLMRFVDEKVPPLVEHKLEDAPQLVAQE
ncbi:MAG TPA: glucoamylase family protein [Planctomycetota bacterium]|nr:glucoamylase family protein [Planctomycetota bacterium]